MGTTLLNLGTAGTPTAFAPDKPHGHARIQFDLPSDYTALGIPAFTASIKTALGQPTTSITVVDVQQVSPCAGYKLWFDRANDKLMVYQGNGAAADAEVAGHTDLSAVVDCEMLVTYI